MKLNRTQTSPSTVGIPHDSSHQPRPARHAEHRHHRQPVDGFDSKPLAKLVQRELQHLLVLLQRLSAEQPAAEVPGSTDSFSDGGPAVSPPPPPPSDPVSGGSAAGGGSTAANPFEHGNVVGKFGPGCAFASPNPDLTWDQLAKLFADGQVTPNMSGSCGMTNDERAQSLRAYWNQCVASGKSPAQCGFNLLCSPSNPPPGVHYG